MNKIQVFRESIKENFAVTIAMLTLNGAKNGKNVDLTFNNLTIDALFRF